MTDHPYKATEDGIVHIRDSKNGKVEDIISNFTATIARDITLDDGAESVRVFEIEATKGARTYTFNVPAERFAAMNWAIEHIGADAVVSAGMGARDKVRAAIQLLSGQPPRVTVYRHLGWRKVDKQWVFLHAGGALGKDGLVKSVEIETDDDLSGYVLEPSGSVEEQRTAIRAVIAALDVGPDRLMVPVIGSPYEAALGEPEHSIHLAGLTGTFKTAIAQLAAQHYGGEISASDLLSWESTANALEAIAFLAKNCVVVVDDFVPSGSSYDQARKHRDADRLLRALGNRSGRRRLRADITLRPSKHPRGIILSTGEDTPNGQSLRARMLILEVAPGDVDVDRLTAAQSDAGAGLYAQALAGFVQYLAPQYDDVRRETAKLRHTFRDRAAEGMDHRRTPQLIADCYLGWYWFTAYARSIDALDEHEVEALRERCWTALTAAGADQETQHLAANPAARFVELLSSALLSGEAHVARFDGTHPLAGVAWGWRERAVGTGDFTRMEWQPQGKRVGWLDGDDLYLDPSASYGVAQIMGQRIGDQLGLTLATMKRRLRDRGLLASTEFATRGTLTVRKMIGEGRREVLHFLSETFLPSSLPDQLDQEDGFAALLLEDQDGQIGESTRPTRPQQAETRPAGQAAPETRPPGNPSVNGVSPDGGRVGRVTEQVEGLQGADRDADKSESAPCSWCEQSYPPAQLDPGGLCPTCSPNPVVVAE